MKLLMQFTYIYSWLNKFFDELNATRYFQYLHPVLYAWLYLDSTIVTALRYWGSLAL